MPPPSVSTTRKVMNLINTTALYAPTQALFELLVGKRAWLLDADDTTWDSERFAFQGCCDVVNRYLDTASIEPPDFFFTARELRERYRGRNAEAIFQQVAQDFGLPIDDEKLAALVAEELDAAIEELWEHCVAAPGVVPALQDLHSANRIVAMVSSSARERLDVCLRKTMVSGYFPYVFSAVDSLPVPRSKPAPDIYLYALHKVGVGAEEAVAFEDGESGAEAAVNAGIDTVGYVGLLPQEEQDEQASTLLNAGAKLVIKDWSDVLPVIRHLSSGI